MRELTADEVESVSGGFSHGTPIPFTNSFIPGANWPGGAPGVISGITAAWAIGSYIGGSINRFNQSFSGMSLGVALHRTLNHTTEAK